MNRPGEDLESSSLVEDSTLEQLVAEVIHKSTEIHPKHELAWNKIFEDEEVTQFLLSTSIDEVDFYIKASKLRLQLDKAVEVLKSLRHHPEMVMEFVSQITSYKKELEKMVNQLEYESFLLQGMVLVAKYINVDDNLAAEYRNKIQLIQTIIGRFY